MPKAPDHRGSVARRYTDLNSNEMGVLAEAPAKALIRRFGPLPAWAEAKLAGAEPARLEAWVERVLEAATLAAVFAEG